MDKNINRDISDYISNFVYQRTIKPTLNNYMKYFGIIIFNVCVISIFIVCFSNIFELGDQLDKLLKNKCLPDFKIRMKIAVNTILTILSSVAFIVQFQYYENQKKKIKIKIKNKVII